VDTRRDDNAHSDSGPLQYLSEVGKSQTEGSKRLTERMISFTRQQITISKAYLVRLVEDDRFARVNFGTIEKLEHDLKQGACSPRADEATRQNCEW
jgi:hypothetical protein